MKNIAIYGAGGFGREVACLIRMINEKEPRWNLIGFFDDVKEKGSRNEYGEILGGMEALNNYSSALCVVFAIGSPHGVAGLVNRVVNPSIEYPNIIAPNVRFVDDKNLKLGRGNIFSWDCHVSCNVKIGDFNTFNGYIAIGHDVTIANFNSIMPAVKISGGVKIGERNFIGVNSVILQNKSIGNDTTIGAGSVVLRNTKDGNTYVGNPAIKVIY